MNLARPFKAGKAVERLAVSRVATPESGAQLQTSLRDERDLMRLVPALKGRAKLIPTLRVEELWIL